MYLSKLIDTSLKIDIQGITSDSRLVKKDYLFVILSKNNNTMNYVYEAIGNGACAILSEETYTYEIPNIIVDNPLSILKEILPKFYKNYAKQKLIGITGTDGKTSTALFTHHLLDNSAYIGTNGIIYNNKKENSFLTTPILSTNYALLDYFSTINLNSTIMEVSSEGILNNRIYGLEYDYAVFTNLSHEHLNTHKTMNSYLETKMKLFNQLKKSGLRIINNDDIYSSNFINDKNTYTFGIKNKSDFQILNIRFFNDFTLFDFKTPTHLYKDLSINRSEIYNLYNLMPAMIIALCENIPIDIIKEKIKNIPVIEGRLEKIPNNKDINIYIDFAHTPNALENVLSSVKQKTKGKLIHVFSSAGRKDKTKRPLMGRVSDKYADLIILTSEDPKDEDPKIIINDIKNGISNKKYKCILSREKAIKKALKLARKEDTVIITGKGRENTFVVNNNTYVYSDFDVVTDYLTEKKD
jgi:UDP-N-acetylmuramoyl-L-alanyl-D-glutamate--2,6-diaminopimelate ligase